MPFGLGTTAWHTDHSVSHLAGPGGERRKQSSSNGTNTLDSLRKRNYILFWRQDQYTLPGGGMDDC